MFRRLIRRMRNTHEGLVRSVVKSASYRMVMVMVSISVAFAFTRSVSASVGIGLVTNVIKTFTYFGYERLWARVNWGYETER